jgi:hypothetical protein
MDAWPYFTGIKVGKIYLYSCFIDYLVPLIGNRHMTRYKIIPELGG